MTDLTSHEQYDSLVDRLADLAVDRADDRPQQDDLWEAVSDFVPEMTAPVCDRVLSLSTSEPMVELVEEVTQVRDSDAAEYRRAEAVTVLLQDVQARVATRIDGDYDADL